MGNRAIQEGAKIMLAEKEKSPLKQQQAQQVNNLSIAEKNAFINNFYKDLSGLIEIREISKAGKAKSLFFKSAAEAIEYQPPQDKNIYIGMLTRTRRSGKKEAVKHTQALWLDVDNKNSEYTIDFLIDRGKLPQPSAVINSGNGKHIYYKLDQPAGLEIEPVVKKLAKHTGADIRAAEAARIMRLPGSLNVKDEPLKCEVLSLNDNIYNLDYFIKLLNIKQEELKQAHRKPQQAELALDVDYEAVISQVNKPCIKAILGGAEEGERNWLLGRLVKHLKNEMAFSKKKTKNIIRLWNLRNNPQQNEAELLESFKKYWHTDYNLTGCYITDKQGEPIPQLQQILNKYCDKETCPLADKIEFKIDQAAVDYNNWLLYHIKDISAYELIIYGILSMNKQGLTAAKISEIMGITKKTFRKHAKKSKFIKIKKGIKQRGLDDIYYLSRKGTYNLGRSAISYAAIRLLNSELRQDLLKPADIKVYMLLRYYEFKSKSGEVYPATTTLAEKIGSSRSRISACINRLEARDIVEINREKRRSNTYYFKIR